MCVCVCAHKPKVYILLLNKQQQLFHGTGKEKNKGLCIVCARRWNFEPGLESITFFLNKGLSKDKAIFPYLLC